MTEPYVGEIRMVGFNFAPRGWAFCDGQLLTISQNDALFSLLGTIYGGDGRTTFGLPDLRGRLPMHYGTGFGLSARAIGAKIGSETVTLNSTQMPSHGHNMLAQDVTAHSKSAAGNMFADSGHEHLYTEPEALTEVPGGTVQNAGGGQPHDNIMPSIVLHFVIALLGVYPSRQ